MDVDEGGVGRGELRLRRRRMKNEVVELLASFGGKNKRKKMNENTVCGVYTQCSSVFIAILLPPSPSFPPFSRAYPPQSAPLTL